MAVNKLPEFAKNGQQNTDGLNLEDGFPVNLKPARQWFNFLFNKLSLSINQIIDEKADKKSVNRHYQNVDSTVLGAPTVDVGIIITDVGWVIYNNKVATFNPALPMSSGGTGRTDGKAQALVNARTVQFSGSATGSFNYDGSGNSSCVLTLANSGVVASTYGSSLKIPTITVNQQGLITGVYEKEVTKTNLGLDKFTQNPNLNTAVGAPNVDAAIVISDSGWGIYKNSSATNFDPALPMSSGGTGRTDGKAQALVNARNIELWGAVSGNADFDGSGNLSIQVTLNQGLGINQKWQNVTSYRANNTIYTNSRPYPISIAVGASGRDASVEIYVGGVLVVGTSNIYDIESCIASGTAIVPPGEQYQASAKNKYGNGLRFWSELF